MKVITFATSSLCFGIALASPFPQDTPSPTTSPPTGKVICCYPGIEDGLGCHPCRPGEVAPSMTTLTPSAPLATPKVFTTIAARLEDKDKPKLIAPWRPSPKIVKKQEYPSESECCMLDGLLPVCNTDKAQPCGSKKERSIEVPSPSPICYIRGVTPVYSEELCKACIKTGDCSVPVLSRETFDADKWCCDENDTEGCHECHLPPHATTTTASGVSLVTNKARSENAASQCCIDWPGRYYHCDDSLCPAGVTSTTVTVQNPREARATGAVSDTSALCYGPGFGKSSTDAGTCMDGNFLDWNGNDCQANCHCDNSGNLKCDHPSDCGPDKTVNDYCKKNANFQCDCPWPAKETRDEPVSDLVARSDQSQAIDATTLPVESPSSTSTTLATKVSPARRQQTYDFHISCHGNSQGLGRHTCKKLTIDYQDCAANCQCDGLGTMTCKAPSGSDCSDNDIQQYCIHGNAYFGCACSHVPDLPPKLTNVIPGTKDPRIPPQSWYA